MFNYFKMKIMKNIALFLLLFIAISACNNESTESTDLGEKGNTSIVADFLDDISSLESIENVNPIVLFQESAENNAAEVISFSKDNIEDVLSKAKKYKHCVITIEDHTIIKITDIEDCTQSGSWGACMPFAKGYIKKGELVSQNDYINNIIGMPDSQERIMYLFN